MLLAVWGLPQAAEAAICQAELGQKLDAIADQPLLQRTQVGILIETQAANPQDRRILYARNPDQFFVPASNAKLLTSAAVLHALGPDYRIRTSIHGEVQPNGLTALQVVGRGDPSLDTADLETLAAQLQNRGVQQVSRLIGDDAYFPGAATNPNWEWEDVQAAYGAPVNSLILNQNAIRLTLLPQTVGQPLQATWSNPALAAQWPIVNRSITAATGAPVTLSVSRQLGDPAIYVDGQLPTGSAADHTDLAVPNPANAFAQQFQQILQQAGIPVAGTSTTAVPLAPLPPEIAAVESPTVAELLIPTNRDSNNLYAEALLKTLGITTALVRPTQATDAGLAQMTAALESLGVSADSFELVDGSGLSRQNLVTPAALVATLQAMAHHPDSALYRNSLAVAGESGTLRNRLRGTPLAGNLQGKSGALTGDVTLSGYVTPPDTDPLVFTILINRSDQHASRLRQIIDDMLGQVAQLGRC